MSFSISVERLIDRWQRDGLVDQETASRLHADLKKRTPHFSLGSVLATLGGLLLGAAVIMLVAANWQDMPRLMRLAFVFVLIWVGYIGGAWRQSRGDRILPPALYILGAASFGAGIALVGQMYHMSGDMQSAALIWAGGVLVSAFLLRAPVLSAVGAGVACFYLSTYIINPAYGDLSYRWAGPLMALIGVAVALFTRSRLSAHLWALFMICWTVLIYSEDESFLVLILMVVGGTALMMVDFFSHENLQKRTRFAHPLASYGLILALLALGIMQMDHLFSSTSEGALNHDVLYGILILAFSVGALALCGRENGGLRSIAYAAFSFEVLYLAFATVGSMIGTSGFFLTAGILVLLLAAFVRRMEQRFGHARTNGGLS
ncbi:DUF2157 domain-containing protein [Falsochrobactrum shanghaiense]|uniref:DUF2157 domain-containing protein n=1 Tax=Falsochrobactrum shanghaiense TaxID=2201899 RepID=A0A316J7W1_9HYPH|nr:DUF2157 domain-containing protein [Falsochrobactrum shanghaiense]PWL17997.1 DUF2157 domain-containing protein [Falsochrobactrum shanghaiense]